MKPAIRAENLSKRYLLGKARAGGYRTLRESLAEAVKRPWRKDAARPKEEILHALDKVSFEVQPGDVTGLIGRNGAGKSTLLKVLSRITEPSEGRVVLRGRVGSLLEVGTGFHPELTGRENIYLNGSILGMTRREIARKFAEIVEFAEIAPFLDTPVKRYSSGMYVKLAFAVAANLNPEILLVDEVLAVGDVPFQKKCLGKMGDVARSGRTVIVVSHNMASLLNLCGQVIVIQQGRLTYQGECKAGIELYMRSCSDSSGGRIDLVHHANRRPGSKAYLQELCFRDRNGEVTDQFSSGDPVAIELTADTHGAGVEFNFHIGVDDAFGTRLFTVATNLSEGGPLTVKEGRQTVVCRLDELPLAPGRYAVSCYIGPLYKPLIDSVEHAAWIEVIPGDFYGNGRMPAASEGRFLVRSRWETA
jgi:lipopolysaccharide transport system ATP-binding protein